MTHLKRALSSVKPDAKASTALGVPIFRRANMARYLSKRGSFVSRSLALKSSMLSSETTSGAGFPDRRPEVGGAGSIDVYVLVGEAMIEI